MASKMAYIDLCSQCLNAKISVANVLFLNIFCPVFVAVQVEVC